MSGNSSISSNDSLLQPNQTSINASISIYFCFLARPGSIISISYYITNILLLLPLCTFILYLGLQRWRQQRSTNKAVMMSHSDVFIYHMVTIELVGVLGQIIFCYGILSGHANILTVAFVLWSFTWYGETLFHMLTCFERYLAVVHPITYMNLKGERGIRIRNIIIGCVWLLCIGGQSLILLGDKFVVVHLCLMLFTLIFITFCSLSVLCVLIRPGPGEQGGDRKGVDQSKQRAFHTIAAILGVLVLKFFMNLVNCVLHLLNGLEKCVFEISCLWLNLPSGLVLPLLFLHRAGKLVCCKNNKK